MNALGVMKGPRECHDKHRENKQEVSGAGVADRWDTVVGCQNLEWFLQPYGQSREEFQKKENGFGRSSQTDIDDFKDYIWCYCYPIRHIIKLKT